MDDWLTDIYASRHACVCPLYLGLHQRSKGDACALASMVLKCGFAVFFGADLGTFTLVFGFDLVWNVHSHKFDDAHE
jgi:hypothetical protein